MPAIPAALRLLPLLLLGALGACSDSQSPPAIALPSTPAVAAAAAAPGSGPAALSIPDFTRLVEAQGPVVVNVVAIHERPAPGAEGFGSAPIQRIPEFLRRFLPEQEHGHEPSEGPGPVRGLGSGFIISRDGLIITNAHLVAGAGTVTVRLADGKREFPGKVLGLDRKSDVALLKIQASGLPVASLGNSATMKPGEWVAAIGSPFGFTNTITAGIVSATNRELPDEPTIPFIQTDVAVNPGNSGGPLINTAGQVVGINTKIYSGTGGYMGVSFAIPIEVALDVAKQLQSRGKVTRGSLGVVIQPMTEELARAFRMQAPEGVLVSAVADGSPADRAGLKSGDVILQFQGRAVSDTVELPRLIAGSQPQSMVELSVWRDATRHQVRVKVGEPAPEPPTEAPAPSRADAGRLDLVVSEIPPGLLEHMGIDFGLMVEAVRGPADTPLRPGDVIIAINQTRFSSEAQFRALLAKHKAGDTVALLLRRGMATAYVTVKTPERMLSAHG